VKRPNIFQNIEQNAQHHFTVQENCNIIFYGVARASSDATLYYFPSTILLN
jgi:hypothetical protein